ncbi:hypothetical protein BPC006_I0614 [Burkholderia pseudomallei BPC006]|nr:hypothetical protein BPC006_I0614 [Burkholderia pseudomallei BPC006]
MEVVRAGLAWKASRRTCASASRIARHCPGRRLWARCHAHRRRARRRHGDSEKAARIAANMSGRLDEPGARRAFETRLGVLLRQTRQAFTARRRVRIRRGARGAAPSAK